jgi:hypothetical protein
MVAKFNLDAHFSVRCGQIPFPLFQHGERREQLAEQESSAPKSPLAFLTVFFHGA